MISNPWFRLYSRMMTDPKIEMLSFEDQRHFVWLLCMKNEGYLDEDMPSDDAFLRMLGRKLGLPVAELSGVKQRLMEVGLISEQWQPVSWDSLQVLSDKDLTRNERQRRYRENKRNALRNALCNATNDVEVTHLETETDTDTDTDTDTEKNVVVLTDVVPCPENTVVTTNGRGPHCDAVTTKRPKKTPSRKTKWPADATLADEWIAAAMAINPSCNVRTVFETFRDHWLGNGETKADWLATWRNWIRRDAQFSRRPSQRQQYEPVAVQHRRI